MTRVAGRTRVRVHVAGIVQGVGFRPFVHAAATRLDLTGFVGNDEAGVVLEAEGDPSAVDALVDLLRQRPPPLAVVESVTVRPAPTTGATGFAIAASTAGHRGGAPRTLVPADTATCDACLAEMADPAARRHRYPFTNCTDCGPRFTIVRDVPYDRATTTMAGFAMCAACAAEYHDPGDRRFHAQPLCCPACGPTLRLDGAAVDPVDRAVRRLRAGEVLAVKGLGGYHLAVRADDETAVARLRRAKHREDKPFAVMAADLDAAAALVTVDAAGATLLTSRRRPIVLLPRRTDAAVAPSVAPGTRELGVLLPYTPLHHLLVAGLGVPMVLTSGNVSDEPIAHRDDDAAERLAPLADGILTHDRAIHTRVDDSVLRTARGRPVPVRRARGYAPEPVPLGFTVDRPVLAVGAEQKNTVAVAAGRRAFLSSHIGDLENLATLQAFTAAVEHLGRLFAIEPRVVAHDLHPEYLSTKYALDRDDLEAVGVQHHHAHVASCLAEHGWGVDDGPVLGIAYDGTGWGTDGTIWGGELLLASLGTAQRVGHLATVGLPGGAAAVRAPWRMAAAWMGRDGADLAVARRHADRWDAVAALAGSPVTLRTSSAGRLCDAVAALRRRPRHRDLRGAGRGGAGAADRPARAVRLPGRVCRRGDRGGRPRWPRSSRTCAPASTRVGSRRGSTTGSPTRRCVRRSPRRGDHGVGTAALSGGVFLNAVLLERVRAGLEAHGLRVLVHERVPCTDGGLALGQVAVAACRSGAGPAGPDPGEG